MGSSIKTIDHENITSFYKNTYEYLTDELEKLDLLLRYHFEKDKVKNYARKDNVPSDLCLIESYIEFLLNKKDKEISFPDLENLAAEIKNKEKEILEKLEISRKNDIYLPFDILQQLFNLSYYEIQILIVALAPVLDEKYEKIYAYLNDSVYGKKPSYQLLYKLFCRTTEEIVLIRELLNPFSALMYWELLCINDNGHSVNASTMFEIDYRISNFLLGNKFIDPSIVELMEIKENIEDKRINFPNLANLNDEQKIFLKNYINLKNNKIHQEKNSGALLHFTGENHSDKEAFTLILSELLQTSLISINWNLLARKSNPLKFMKRIFRESLLFNSIIAFNRISDDSTAGILLEEIFHLSGLCNNTVILYTSQVGKVGNFLNYHKYYCLHFPMPEFQRRVELWNEKINGTVIKSAENLVGNLSQHLAENFLFSEEQISRSLLQAKNYTLMKQEGIDEINYHELLMACKSQCIHELDTLGVKIEQTYSLEDVVLPQAQTKLIQELIVQSRYKHFVFSDWGFEKKIQYGRGLAILFSGSSGTGKTMSASVVARELSRDLYKIDLSSIVSKYIGETEKNLSKIFDEARKANVVLFFDEADALFGKRTDISNAHDRYANLEISYLLQKMEEFDGITILATNLGQNIDEAFKRRIQVVIEFPFPEVSERQKIWEKIFPKDAPVDKNIDYQFLAQKVEVSGGYIKNIALSAAFYAAPVNEQISMSHILRAVQKEYKKLSKSFLRSEFLPYYDEMNLMTRNG